MISDIKKSSSPNTIPKIIHYCWFGGNPLGVEEIRCIDSWKRFFPDYTIMRWDESNFDVRCIPYDSQAYDAKKWAIVSDYARFAVLYKFGGLYFDTDVEVIRPMDDIISKGPFMGFETDAGEIDNNLASVSRSSLSVNPGLGLSANPGLYIYKLILDSYSEDEFIRSDGTFNQTTVVVRTTKILRSFGLADAPGIQEVAGVTIYPSEYFNPKDFYTGEIRKTGNTRSIHHFGMSWVSEKDKYRHRVLSWGLKRGLTMRAAGHLARVCIFFHFFDVKHIYRFFRKGLSKCSE